MLDDIKLLLGISTDEKDTLLNLLLQQTIDYVKTYTHREDISMLSSIIEQIVVYRYNRIGTEGLESESYSGVSYHYTDDIPKEITNVLKKYRLLRSY